jgi:hypothetical protein
MLQRLRERRDAAEGQPTVRFRLLYYAWIVFASGVLVGILYLGSCMG